MTQEQCKSIFCLAGIEVLHMWELPNQYWPKCVPEDWTDKNQINDYLRYAKTREQSPWWLVKTGFGLIEIGWRKRVISIDWNDTPIRKIVTQEQVTKCETMVHAYSTEKAVEYLKFLQENLLEPTL